MYNYRPNINPALQPAAKEELPPKSCITCPANKVCQKVQNRINCHGHCEITLVLLINKMVELMEKKREKKEG